MRIEKGFDLAQSMLNYLDKGIPSLKAMASDADYARAMDKLYNLASDPNNFKAATLHAQLMDMRAFSRAQFDADAIYSVLGEDAAPIISHIVGSKGNIVNAHKYLDTPQSHDGAMVMQQDTIRPTTKDLTPDVSWLVDPKDFDISTSPFTSGELDGGVKDDAKFVGAPGEKVLDTSEPTPLGTLSSEEINFINKIAAGEYK